MRLKLRRWAGGFLGAAALVVAPRPSVACPGDCNGDGTVTIDELVRAVTIALGEATVDVCVAADNNVDGKVTVDELVLSINKALNGCSHGPAGEVLLSTQGLQLDQYDLASGAVTTTVPTTRGQLAGPPCLLPGGAGNFAIGDQTAAVHGWSIFSPDGTFLSTIPPLPAVPNSAAASPQPVRCAVDASGDLFGVAVGTPGGSDGQLWEAFPPDYTQACLLDGTLRAPGAMAIDAAGALYVPESVPGGDVLRIAPPFPATAGSCAAPVSGTPMLPKSAFVTYTDSAVPTAVAQDASGQWFVSVLNGDDTTQPGIREHGADGTFLREVFPPGTGGSPVGLAFDSAGGLYYADLGLAGTPPQAAAGKGTLRRVTFAADGTPAVPELVARGLDAPDGLAVVPSRTDEWLTLGGGLRRTFFNPFERQINPGTVGQLIQKWSYVTSGMISAQAAVVWLDLPNEGRTQVVIVPSWDQHVYALRAANGSRVWQYEMQSQPGAAFTYSASPTIGWLNGAPRVYVPGGETMYCLDAVTGQELWRFNAGTGCTDCTEQQEGNEIESTPVVVNGMVIVGMDVNSQLPGNGGMFALRADDGRLVWWFDLFTQSTCRPNATDNIRQFDGYHTAAELGLSADFLTTRPGCNFDRTQYGCGNVWSSPAVDMRRGLIYTGSANCTASFSPLPPLEEAIFAVHLDGTPAWQWRPRATDPNDLDFGAVPNLFEVTIGGAVRDVVGIGSKDGTYYLLDRDGVNAITGTVEPYWETHVVLGGVSGGIIGSASVGDGNIVFATAPGDSVFLPEEPVAHALDPASGAVLWEYASRWANFAPTMGVPGLAFTGSTPVANEYIFQRGEGTLLSTLSVDPALASGVASGPTIVDGQLFVGGSVGGHNQGSDAEEAADIDTPLSAFCVQGTPGCATNTCDDHNACTYDYPNASGVCVSEPSADGIDCTVGTMTGDCTNGICVVFTPVPTQNPTPSLTPGGD